MVKEKIIVFFDSECLLCNNSVRFIIKYDKKDRFRFAELGGKFATDLPENEKKMDTDSIVVLTESHYCTKSSAVLRIARGLGGWFFFSVFFYLIPAFIRDYFYDLIAKTRYRIFGKTDHCIVPDTEIKKKFL